jgi:hypothetical protein
MGGSAAYRLVSQTNPLVDERAKRFALNRHYASINRVFHSLSRRVHATPSARSDPKPAI